MPKNNSTSLPPSSYDREYYLTNCGGYQEFIESRGQVLPQPMRVSFRAAQIKSGQRLLDIGCGRGEFIFNAALRGAKAVGIDYSVDAIRLAKETITDIPPPAYRPLLYLANAQYLPFQDSTFDVVVWLDVIEHLTSKETNNTLTEINRVLKRKGRLVVHTMPNLWYYKLGYYLWRIIAPTARASWPNNNSTAFSQARHINEQSVLSLARKLREYGFTSKVWLQTHIETKYLLSHIVHYILLKLPPFKWIFAKDVYAVAIKKRERPTVSLWSQD